MCPNDDFAFLCLRIGKSFGSFDGLDYLHVKPSYFLDDA